MLNLGISELMIVGVLALVFVGPDSLPQLARGAGKLYGKLRRASNELRHAFQLEVDKVDAEARAEEIKRRREAAKARREAQRLAREQAALGREEDADEPRAEAHQEQDDPEQTAAEEDPAETWVAEEASYGAPTVGEDELAAKLPQTQEHQQRGAVASKVPSRAAQEMSAYETIDFTNLEEETAELEVPQQDIFAGSQPEESCGSPEDSDASGS